MDPELSDVPLESAAEPSSVPQNEVIEDPELAGVPRAPEAKPADPTAFRTALHTRFGVDTAWQNDRESVIEGTQIAIFEATHKRNDELRFAAGLRGRYRFTRRRTDSGSGRAARYELDVSPTAGYVDATLASGVHVRIGYQMLSLGRFDVFSATNFLAVLDLRDGFTAPPEAMEIAQPALRADIDLSSELTLQTFYVPFFQPHLASIYGTDYALLAPLEKTPAASSNAATGTVLDHTVTRSQLSAISASGVRALGPEPDFQRPQAALRLTARLGAGELAFTALTALEHMPSLVASPELDNLLTELNLPNPDQSKILTDVGALINSRTAPLSVEHERFNVLSLDGATAIGPVQLGAETAYINGRTLYVARAGRAPRPEQVDMLHLGLRAELAEADFAASFETFAAYALEAPGDRRWRWMMLSGDHWLEGAAIAGRWNPGAGKLAVETFALAFNGPSFFLAPRLEYAVADNVWLELGAFFVEGPEHHALGDPRISIGGLYDDTDQVFTGVRWLP